MQRERERKRGRGGDRERERRRERKRKAFQSPNVVERKEGRKEGRRHNFTYSTEVRNSYFRRQRETERDWGKKKKRPTTDLT